MHKKILIIVSHSAIFGIWSLFISSDILHAQTSTNTYDNTRPAVSPDGKRVAFESNRDGQMEIYIMNLDGSSQTRLTDYPGRDLQPCWSPDGTKIVFVSERDGAADIYMMHNDGSDLKQLTKNLEGGNGPKWSPDGNKIVFKAGAWPRADIFVMNADGSNLQNLTPNTDTYDHSPAWSPSGAKIAFTSNKDEQWEIWTMQADGANPARLTNNDYTDEIPNWSPDGLKLTYQGRSSGDVEVHVIDANGSSPARLTDGPAFNELPVWSPDGQKIFFQSNRDGHWEIYLMSVDGSSQTRTTFQPQDWLDEQIKRVRIVGAIKELEKTLVQNPDDDFALQCLKLIISKPFAVSRDECLRLRQVVKRYSKKAHIVIPPQGEPGVPIIVSGTIRNGDRQPVKGALIYVFHTDAQGLYTPDDAKTGRMDEPNSRLFGYMRTGPDGHYSFRTIRPGGYPKPISGLSGNRRFIPQHIHLIVTAAGYEDYKCKGSTCQLVFEDDLRMTPEWHKWAEEGGNPVLKSAIDEHGVQKYEYDIVLVKKE